MRTTAIACALLLAVTAGGAKAEDAASYPGKPVRIIVNVTPGGGVDLAARIVAQHLAEKLGQSFSVENRGGGAGNIAAEAVANAAPDGYTLLASFNSTVSVNDLLFPKLGYDPMALVPVSVLTYVPLVLVVRKDFPATTAAEFMDYVKANPGKLTFGSNSVGAASHLTAEYFMRQTGTRMTHVPYKGTNPVLTDLLGGNIDLTFIQYSAFYELHRQGKVRILAVCSEKRIPALPDIPTFAELGYPDIVSKTWNLISAPPKTPRPILEKLNTLIDGILHDPAIEGRLAQTHVAVEGGSLEYAEKYRQDDRRKWGEVIRAANIKAE
jgi:tripartite-type tricarboxylate transporter receptor subunit TctC